MSTDLTVYYDGIAIEVNVVVFETMNLKPGQALTAQQLVQFIEVESAALLAGFNMLRLVGYDIPSTSDFEATLVRILEKLR
jgi:hypothetical protein